MIELKQAADGTWDGYRDGEPMGKVNVGNFITKLGRGVTLKPNAVGSYDDAVTIKPLRITLVPGTAIYDLAAILTSPADGREGFRELQE